MPSSFLELSKSISLEVAAGRLSTVTAKKMLRINANLIVNSSIHDKLNKFKWNLGKYKNLAIDYPGEGHFQ